MRNPHRVHEPHLTLRKITVPPGGEWLPRLSCWTLIQVGEGGGYCLQTNSNQEVEAGAVLLAPAETPVTLRASHLNPLELDYFSVAPRRLGGLLTLGEQGFFQAAASGRGCAFQIHPATHPVAVKMKELCGSPGSVGLLLRLKLLQLFVEAFGGEPGQTSPNDGPVDARERLRALLQETPASELLEMNSSELAQRTHCTARHFSRIFRELVGMSFQDKRAELRLARARELLATSDSKIVDVALESGYKSLSLFNLMFARRFGSSPGKWRHKHASQPGRGRKRTVTLVVNGVAD